MNELTTLSDAELDKEIENIKEREVALKTKAGRDYIVVKMRECIGLLETWGYRFDGDEMALARLWAEGLQEEFVRLGADGIQLAVRRWAETDESEYRSFPKIPWIAKACGLIGGDPRVEKGRRVQAEAERKIEEEHKAEMERYKKEHPEEWAKIDKRASEYLKKIAPFIEVRQETLKRG